jgi:CBS domain-containing protein
MLVEEKSVATSSLLKGSMIDSLSQGPLMRTALAVPRRPQLGSADRTQGLRATAATARSRCGMTLACHPSSQERIMKVADVMSYRPCIIGEFETVQRAAQMMRANVVGALPVVERGRLVGIVTDRDLVTRGMARGEVPWDLRVREVMTPNPALCTPEEPLERVVERMIARSIRRILVIDKGGVAGVLSLEDLAVRAEAQPLALRLLAHLATIRGELDGAVAEVQP